MKRLDSISPNLRASRFAVLPAALALLALLFAACQRPNGPASAPPGSPAERPEAEVRVDDVKVGEGAEATAGSTVVVA
jgi:hypothetical protein